MSSGKIGGLITGAAIGAATALAFGMMSRPAKQRMRNMATDAANKMTAKAEKLFGK